MQKVMSIFATLLISYSVSADVRAVISKDERGNIRNLNQLEAMSACATGFRLATVREAAQIIQNQGGKGILELNLNGNLSEFYSPGQMLNKISGINPGGQRDEFYYSNVGYQVPKNEFSNNWFWTSSIDSNDPVYKIYGYQISGATGKILSFNRKTRHGAALCVPVSQ